MAETHRATIKLQPEPADGDTARCPWVSAPPDSPVGIRELQELILLLHPGACLQLLHHEPDGRRLCTKLPEENLIQVGGEAIIRGKKAGAEMRTSLLYPEASTHPPPRHFTQETWTSCKQAERSVERDKAAHCREGGCFGRGSEAGTSGLGAGLHPEEGASGRRPTSRQPCVITSGAPRASTCL